MSTLVSGEQTTVRMAVRPTDALLGLFFASGFVGLLVEQVYERLLSTIVGGSTPAAAVVLSVYFFGLGLGGFLAAWLLKRRVNPVRAYGWAELVVALGCAAVLLGFNPAAEQFAKILMWASGSPVAMLAARVLVAIVVVLPSTIAMGMSFPFLSDIAAQTQQSGRYIARLYTGNLLGAAAASALAPYLIFPYVGLSGALILCIVVDGLVAIIAIRLAPGAQSTPAQHCKSGILRFRDAPLLAIAFLSGFLFFALEVIWTHLVAVTINSSVYAFSSMLFFVTLGLGMGSRAVSRVRARAGKEFGLGMLFMLSAGLLAFQTLLWPQVPLSLAGLGINLRGFYPSEALRWIHLALLLLPTTFAFGMIYPTLFSDRRFGAHGAGRLVGCMSGLNAAGCVLGALVASFWLIPVLGSQTSLRALVVTLVACGLIMLVAIDQPRAHLGRAIAGAAAIVLVVLVLPPWNPLTLTSGMNVYFRPDFVSPTSRLLYFHEDCYGGVTTVVENESPDGPVKVLLTNGKFQGDDGHERDAQIAFASIPTMHVAERNKALVIGLGTGQSASVLFKLGFGRIHIAELAPGIIAAAKEQFSALNHNVLASPQITVHLEDGRNVLLSSPEKYDLISIEVSSIWFAGSTSIYSEDFYKLARSRLTPRGVFQQWVQLHHISGKEVDSILASVREVFPHVSLWYFGGQGVIVASVDSLSVVPESQAAVQAYVASQLGGTAQAAEYLSRLAGSLLLDERAVDRLHATRPVINTDWNRWLEYATPRYNHTSTNWKAVNLQYLRQYTQ